jgi:hypothetical protein
MAWTSSDPQARAAMGLGPLDVGAKIEYPKEEQEQRDAARRALRPDTYAKGGPVARKNDHPFNKSFDNTLLLKSRRS